MEKGIEIIWTFRLFNVIIQVLRLNNKILFTINKCKNIYIMTRLKMNQNIINLKHVDTNNHYDLILKSEFFTQCIEWRRKIKDFVKCIFSLIEKVNINFLKWMF